MMEILLDIRDLLSQAPPAAPSGSGGGALEKLEAIRRLTQRR
jgi:hypothetical protein